MEKETAISLAASCLFTVLSVSLAREWVIRSVQLDAASFVIFTALALALGCFAGVMTSGAQKARRLENRAMSARLRALSKSEASLLLRLYKAREAVRCEPVQEGDAVFLKRTGLAMIPTKGTVWFSCRIEPSAMEYLDKHRGEATRLEAKAKGSAT